MFPSGLLVMSFILSHLFSFTWSHTIPQAIYVAAAHVGTKRQFHPLIKSHFHASWRNPNVCEKRHHRDKISCQHISSSEIKSPPRSLCKLTGKCQEQRKALCWNCPTVLACSCSILSSREDLNTPLALLSFHLYVKHPYAVQRAH